ncbi:hypothetical protein [Amycolatopsis sp. NPDC003731]
MSIINIVDKWGWYSELIQAGCPDKLLKVAFCIADYVNNQTNKDGSPVHPDVYGLAFPSQKEHIAPFTGLSVSRVSEKLSELVEAGWLVLTTRTLSSGGKKNYYQLAIGQSWEKRKQNARSIENLRVGRSTTSESQQVPLPNSGKSTSENEQVPLPSFRTINIKETSTQADKETSTRASARPEGLLYSSKDEGVSIDNKDIRIQSIDEKQQPPTSEYSEEAPELLDWENIVLPGQRVREVTRSGDDW